jgi:hypothetical protein
MAESAGEAAAAKKNREREARAGIIDAFRRLGIPESRWPAFAREFDKDPAQRIEYRDYATPLPFQAPDFDRLNQSPDDWVKLANKAWEQHRQEFLQKCQDWVDAGLDEPIPAMKRARGRGRKNLARGGKQVLCSRRFEWAAKYLLRIPLKEIAGADAEPSTVGRDARNIIKAANWPIK